LERWWSSITVAGIAGLIALASCSGDTQVRSGSASRSERAGDVPDSVSVGAFPSGAATPIGLVLVSESSERETNVALLAPEGQASLLPPLPPMVDRAAFRVDETVDVLGVECEPSEQECGLVHYRLETNSLDWRTLTPVDLAVTEDAVVEHVGDTDVGTAVIRVDGATFVASEDEFRRLPDTATSPGLLGSYQQCVAPESGVLYRADWPTEAEVAPGGAAFTGPIRSATPAVWSLSLDNGEDSWRRLPAVPIEDPVAFTSIVCTATHPLVIADGVEYATSAHSDGWESEPIPLLQDPENRRLLSSTSTLALPNGALVTLPLFSSTMLHRSADGTWAQTDITGDGLLPAPDGDFYVLRGESNAWRRLPPPAD
jgi:hypothetical protein